MLSAHPSLAMLHRETHLILQGWRQRHRFEDLSRPVGRREAVSWVIDRDDSRFGWLELDEAEARRRLMAAPPTLGSVLGTPFAMFAEKQGKARWGDKDPWYAQVIPGLMTLYPDAQIMLMIRDPRACIASMRKLGWLDKWYDGTVAGGIDLWLRSVTGGQRAKNRYRKDQIHEIRYETLISDTERTVRQMCAFYGLDPAGVDAMLSYNEQETDLTARQLDTYHPKLSRGVSADTLDSWRKHLSMDEIAVIESVTATHMDRYGYEPIAQGVRPPAELLDRYQNFRKKNRGNAKVQRPVKVALPARLTTAERRRESLRALLPGRR
jgi:hypothetical protein